MIHLIRTTRLFSTTLICRFPLIAPSPATYLHSSNVSDNPGARKKKKRVGRGERSGKGKTSGRGQKGWHARASKSRPVPGFEGGQSGILKSIPQMGSIHNPLHKFKSVALDTLQFWINRGKIDATKKITVKELFEARCIKNIKQGIYLSDQGSQFLTSKIDIEVQETSAGAIDAVERLEGSIEKVYHSQRDMKALLHPHLFAVLPTEAQLPQDWKDLRRYVGEDSRGYLASPDESISDIVTRVMNATRPIRSKPGKKLQ